MSKEIVTSGPVKRLFAGLGLGLAGVIALSGCSLLEDSGDTDSTEVSNDQVDAAADAAAGDCLPEEVVGGDSSEFAIDCADPAAFWTLTAISTDSGATAAGGDLADYQPVFDLCGEEIGAYLPGQPRTDWNMIYDEATGAVDYLFCLEAIDKENADGATPVVPNTGDCFSSADAEWSTLPCDSDLADATVTNAIAFDTADWAAPDVESAVADCVGGYYELIDQFDRTNGVICFE